VPLRTSALKEGVVGEWSTGGEKKQEETSSHEKKSRAEPLEEKEW
jgi:hypothetical protein